MRSLYIAATAFCFTLPLSDAAKAWDDHGHRIVALVADHYLTPDVRKRVNDILAADPDPSAPRDIVAAATWATDRTVGAPLAPQGRSPGSPQWHYAKIQAARPSIPAACSGHRDLPQGVPASKGPAQACVIDKIDEFAAELADRKTDPGERTLAVKYLLNLVADVHQPLRVADEHSEYGTVIPVVAADGSITPGDLFGYWDSAFVHRLGQDERKVADGLIAGISPSVRERWSGRVTHLWALEAHQLGVNFGYGTMLSAIEPGGKFSVSAAEMARATQLVGQQLSKAGVRLANLLNQSLSSTSPAVAQAAPLPTSNIESGRALALADCRICHVIPGDQRESNWSLTTAPAFVDVANTKNMSPVVLHDFLTGPHPTMPQMKLSDEQSGDVIGFIMSLRTRP